MIRILLSDSEPIIRAGLRSVFTDVPDMDVTSETSDLLDAVTLIRSHQPDVWVVGGELVAHEASADFPTFQAVLVSTENLLPILIFGADHFASYSQALFGVGVRGCLLRKEDVLLARDAVISLSKGCTWLSPEVTNQLYNPNTLSGKDNAAELSNREVEIVKLMADGMSNSDIAKHASISIGTVKNHITNIYSKLDMRSRREVIAWAWRSGLDLSDSEKS
jgi:DNA-binding NarL/FixJ family response regulator